MSKLIGIGKGCITIDGPGIGMRVNMYDRDFTMLFMQCSHLWEANCAVSINRERQTVFIENSSDGIFNLYKCLLNIFL